jgi:hypothetical protein
MLQTYPDITLTFGQLAERAPGDRRAMANKLCSELYFMQKQLEDIKNAIDGHIEPEGQKMYMALMRTFLATEKEFYKLLPTPGAEPEPDALADFNKASVYDERGLTLI